MPLATLVRHVARLRAEVQQQTTTGNPVLALLREDPDRLMTTAGLTPDPWQTELLRSSAKRLLLLCSRQSGKSTTAAALALRDALLVPGSLVLLLSPTLRQSGELFHKVTDLYHALGEPVATAMASALRLELVNGSRVVSLPGDEKTIRGYSGVALLIVDEAARVPDALYYSIRPMLAVSGGRLVVLSTPFGKRGFFFTEWEGSNSWHRTKVTAQDCPRISRAFLEEEEQSIGPRWHRQEYGCSFEETVDAVFTYADIAAALSDDVRPLLVG